MALFSRRGRLHFTLNLPLPSSYSQNSRQPESASLIPCLYLIVSGSPFPLPPTSRKSPSSSIAIAVSSISFAISYSILDCSPFLLSYCYSFLSSAISANTASHSGGSYRRVPREGLKRGGGGGGGGDSRSSHPHLNHPRGSVSTMPFLPLGQLSSSPPLWSGQRAVCYLFWSPARREEP